MAGTTRPSVPEPLCERGTDDGYFQRSDPRVQDQPEPGPDLDAVPARVPVRRGVGDPLLPEAHAVRGDRVRPGDGRGRVGPRDDAAASMPMHIKVQRG